MPRILVVDDEWPMQELLRNVLTLSGYEVDIAGNEAEFREKAFAQRPDLIILDLMLGASDGSEVYHQLLSEGLDASIPVVFLSALAQDRPSTPPRPDRKYSLIGKPFDPSELVRQLSEVVNMHK